MALVGDVVVALRASTTGFVGPLRVAQRQLAATGTQAAATGAKVSGLGRAFSLLGGSSIFILIAGIAALRAAYRAFTKDAREAAEANDKMAQSAANAFRGRTDIKIRDIGIQLRGARERAQELWATLQDLEAQDNPELEGGIRRIREELREANRQTQQFGLQLEALEGPPKNALVSLVALMREFHAQAGLSKGAVRELADALASLAAFNKGFTKDKGLNFGSGTLFDPTERDRERLSGNKIGGVFGDIQARQDALVDRLKDTGRKSARSFADAFGESTALERAGVIAGESLMRGVIRSLVDKNVDLAHIFVNTIAALLETALIGAIENALRATKGKSSLLGTFASLAGTVASFIPGAGAVGKGLGVAKDFGGLASQAAPGLSLSVQMSAPSNPLAMARDAEWQRALKDSMDVAKATGYSFA